MNEKEFCDRFIAEMMAARGNQDPSPADVLDYAKSVAPTYWAEDFQREDGPEACAQADVSCWGDQ